MWLTFLDVFNTRCPTCNLVKFSITEAFTRRYWDTNSSITIICFDAHLVKHNIFCHLMQLFFWIATQLAVTRARGFYLVFHEEHIKAGLITLNVEEKTREVLRAQLEGQQKVRANGEVVI